MITTMRMSTTVGTCSATASTKPSAAAVSNPVAADSTVAVKAVAEGFVEAVAGDSTEAVKAVAEGFVAPKGVAGQKHSANQIVVRAHGRAVPALTIADKVNEDAAFPGIKWLFRDDTWIEFTKLLSQLSAEKEIRILMVGLKAAGKTTILHKLKLGETVTTIPAVGFNVETVQYRNITFTVWDVECPDHTHQLWRSYFQNTEGFIFVVDSNDRDQVGKARRELHRMLNEDGLKEAVVLVFAKKGDLPNAFGAPEITDRLAVHGLPQRRWYILTCCATSGEGLYEGLDWLFSNIASKA